MNVRTTNESLTTMAVAAGVGAVGALIVRGLIKKAPTVGTLRHDIPGSKVSAGKSILEAGAALLQNKAPLDAMNVYMDGFHFYADDMGHQMEAHHYCTKLNDDFMQCAIFDGSGSDARLIGVEYILSETQFRKLPEEEKPLWHSHRYEVKSGTLIAPGMPDSAEHKLMEDFVLTYGKTWHTWDTHAHDLPLGPPMLMMAFTADGQLHAELEAERDDRLKLTSYAKRQQRKDIRFPEVVPGCDTWQNGKAPQVNLAERAVANLPQGR